MFYYRLPLAPAIKTTLIPHKQMLPNRNLGILQVQSERGKRNAAEAECILDLLVLGFLFPTEITGIITIDPI